MPQEKRMEDLSHLQPPAVNNLFLIRLVGYYLLPPFDPEEEDAPKRPTRHLSFIGAVWEEIMSGAAQE